MSISTRRFFDRCLVAIISELTLMEEDSPECSEDIVHFASMISEKAEKLREVAAEFNQKDPGAKDRLVKEAVRNGALVLRFLLNIENADMSCVSRCDIDRN